MPARERPDQYGHTLRGRVRQQRRATVFRVCLSCAGDYTRSVRRPAGRIEHRKRTRVEVEPSWFSRDAPARRSLGSFAAGAGWAGIYDLGLHREIKGRPVDELSVVSSPLFKVYLANRVAYDEVDPDARFVPARVSGSIEGAGVTPEGLELAIAVNGVIRAVTVSHGHADQSVRFAAMVPEQSFRPRHNEIEVFILRRDGEKLTLLRGEHR